MPKTQFTVKEKDAIFTQAKTFWQEATNTMSPLFDMVNDCERIWRAQLPKELEAAYAKRPDKAALAPADAYVNLKSLRATIRHMLFSRKPFATLSKNGQPNVRSENVIKQEWVLQSMLDAQHDGAGFESEADQTILQCLYAGISCVFTEWHKHIVRVPVRDPETSIIKIDRDTGYPLFENKVVAEYAETKAIDIRRVRIDPSAESIKKARIIGYQTTIPLSELITLNRDKDYFYDFKEKELTRTTFNRSEYYTYARGEADRLDNKDNESFGDKTIELRVISGLFRFVKPDGSFEVKDLILHIGNEQVLLGVKPNDLPLHTWEMFDFPSIDKELNKTFPMGVIEPMMDTWIEKMIKRNQSIDSANRDSYDTYVGDEAACANLPDRIEHVDGKILKVDTLASQLTSAAAALSPLPRNTGGQDTFNQAASLKRDLQEGMSTNDYTLGLDPSRGETATAVNELVAGAKSLIIQVVKILKDTYFSPVYRKHLILFNFFKGHQLNTIFDNQGNPFTIAPGDIDFQSMVEIDIATSLDQPEMKRRFVEFLPLMLNDPYFDAFTVRKTWVDIMKLPNSRDLLISDEHTAAIIERENLALIQGIPQPVHERDNHSRHIEGHVGAIDFLQTPQGEIEGNVNNRIRFLQVHIEEHQDALDRQDSGALGNTKELGGNAGNLVKPQGASKGPGATTTVGLKSEDRK